MRSSGRKLQGVGLALLVVLAGCSIPRRGAPGAYALDMDSVSATTRHQPSLISHVAGEEQVVNPAWLGWSAAAVATTAAVVVTVVKLTQQQRTDFEQALQRCAQWAEREVNKEELGSERSPKPDECREEAGKDRKGNTRTKAQKWGELKHAKALECVRWEVLPRFPNQILIEPRYRYFRGADRLEYVPPEKVEWLKQQGLYSELLRTFVPDIVIIDGTPFRIRAVYDFKFPCVKPDRIPDWGKNPDEAVFGDLDQGELYKDALKAHPLRMTPWKIEKLPK